MSWHMGTSRGLEPAQRPRSASTRREHMPRLYSDEDRRSRARSSGYGLVTAQPRISKVILSHEEELLAKATFKPVLNDDPIRARVRSTGYGKGQVVYRKPAAEPEQYSFKPKLNNSETARRAREQSKSSSYGRRASQVPSHKHHDGIAPELLFKPNLPKNKARSDAHSSGYGTQSYKPEIRPRTAPSGNNGNKLRYTLYADKPGKENTAEPATQPEGKPAFVNDGVQVAMDSQQRLKYGMHTSEAVNVYDKHTLSETALQIKSKATGSNYAKGWKPKVNQNPEPEYRREEIVDGRSEPRGMSFDRGTTLVSEPQIPENPNREKLNAKVKSSGYKHHYTPEVVPREEPEMAEPSFLTLKSDGAIKPLEQLSPPPRCKQTDAAESSGYGAVSPEKVPRKPRQDSLVWKPNSGISADLCLAASIPPLPGKRLYSTGSGSGSNTSSRKASASRSTRSVTSEDKIDSYSYSTTTQYQEVVTHEYTEAVAGNGAASGEQHADVFETADELPATEATQQEPVESGSEEGEEW